MKLSALNPIARRFYDAMKSALNGQFDVSEGTHVEASLFARARGLARTKKVLVRAADQILPSRAYDLLEMREAEHRIVPGPHDTIPARRAVLAARFLLPGGARKTNVENALLELLGNDFVAYRPTPLAEAVNYPADASDPEVNFQLPTTPRKLIRLTYGVSVGLGASQSQAFALLTGTPEPTAPASAANLLAGDVLMVDPGRLGREERVVVEAVAGGTLTATFEKAHDAGALATTMPFPSWRSTKRHSLIVVSAAAAADPEKRRKVHELMDRMARVVSTWSLTAGTSSGTTGPFTVGGGKIGITTIGAVSLP